MLENEHQKWIGHQVNFIRTRPFQHIVIKWVIHTSEGYFDGTTDLNGICLGNLHLIKMKWLWKQSCKWIMRMNFRIVHFSVYMRRTGVHTRMTGSPMREQTILISSSFNRDMKCSRYRIFAWWSLVNLLISLVIIIII